MKISARLFCVACILVPFDTFADDGCQELRALEAQWNANSPRKIDEYTELTQITVNCATKVVSYKKRILVPSEALPQGAGARKQRQHTQLHCNKNGLASTKEWTAQDVIFDVNYRYVFTLTTRPSDCPSRTK